MTDQFTSETIKVTKELFAAKADLAKEPSYGRALAVQKSRRIRNERVAEARSKFKVV